MDAHNHLQSSSTLVAVLLPVVKDLFLFSTLVAIGLLYAIGFLLPENRGTLGKEANRIKSLALLASIVWVVCTIGDTIVELSNLLGGGFLDAFNWSVISSFLESTSVGRDYVFQLVMGSASIALIIKAKKVGAVYFALAASMLALVVPLFQSHASSAGNHGLAIGSLIFHVAAVSLWVGGVIGLLAISARDRAASIQRFSSLALWSAIIVGVSGVLNAWTRLNFLAGWHSRYGLLIIIKSALFLTLLFIGVRHRNYISKICTELRRFLGSW